MLFDVIWCFLMLCDVIWCYMMLFDVTWCFLMLFDVIWCYLMLFDVIWCYMMLFDVKWCFFDVIWCNMMLFDVIWCYMMLYDIDQYDCLGNIDFPDSPHRFSVTAPIRTGGPTAGRNMENITIHQRPFQEPKLEVPSIYKAVCLGLFFREYPYGQKYGTNVPPF